MDQPWVLNQKEPEIGISISDQAKLVHFSNLKFKMGSARKKGKR